MTPRRDARPPVRRAHARRIDRRPPLGRVVLATIVFGAFILIGRPALGGAGNAPAAGSESTFRTAGASQRALDPGSPAGTNEGPAATPAASATANPDSTGSPGPTASPTGPSAPIGTVRNVYAGAGAGMFAPAVAGIPERVYVPDEASGTVIVIDPKTFRIVRRFPVGASPEHVTPDWDLRRLYVEAAFSNRLTVIDARTARPIGRHTVPGPYNLYFTLDGRRAIVLLDSSRSGRDYGGSRQVYFYDRRTWRLVRALRIPYAGADHLDFSADGRSFVMSTEYAGWLVRIDTQRMKVTGRLYVGGRPIDVRLSPDGKVFFVANQSRNGVSVVDPLAMRELAFIATGRGAHGLAISRDARRLFVTNRRAGTLSVIDFRARKVVRTWRIGGSPDMIAVSPDGTQLWISNRYGGTVSVVNALSGAVLKIIRVGGRPHGLAYFPEPGSISLGHNGIYR